MTSQDNISDVSYIWSFLCMWRITHTHTYTHDRYQETRARKRSHWHKYTARSSLLNFHSVVPLLVYFRYDICITCNITFRIFAICGMGDLEKHVCTHSPHATFNNNLLSSTQISCFNLHIIIFEISFCAFVFFKVYTYISYLLFPFCYKIAQHMINNIISDDFVVTIYWTFMNMYKSEVIGIIL